MEVSVLSHCPVFEARGLVGHGTFGIVADLGDWLWRGFQGGMVVGYGLGCGDWGWLEGYLRRTGGTAETGRMGRMEMV